MIHVKAILCAMGMVAVIGAIAILSEFAVRHLEISTGLGIGAALVGFYFLALQMLKEGKR
jgi:hypothetical protein